MTKVISFAAWKGGVGKTTLTYNLSVLSDSKKILLIDIDPQCNLSKRFLTNWENDIVNNPIPLKTKYNHIDIIVSNNNLINNWEKVNFLKIIEKYQNNYDYIVFDTPPSFNKEIIKAFDISDEIYLISDDSIMSLEGLINTLTQFNDYRNSNNQKSNIKGIILNNLNRFKLTTDLISSLKENPDTKNLILEPYIYKKSAISKTMIFQKPITSMKDKQASQLLLELSKKIFK